MERGPQGAIVVAYGGGSIPALGMGCWVVGDVGEQWVSERLIVGVVKQMGWTGEGYF